MTCIVWQSYWNSLLGNQEQSEYCFSVTVCLFGGWKGIDYNANVLSAPQECFAVEQDIHLVLSHSLRLSHSFHSSCLLLALYERSLVVMFVVLCQAKQKELQYRSTLGLFRRRREAKLINKTMNWNWLRITKIVIIILVIIGWAEVECSV